MRYKTLKNPYDVEHLKEVISNNLRLRISQLRVDLPSIYERAQISEESLYRYRNGATVPETFCLIKLAYTLNTSVGWLVGLADTRKQDDIFLLLERINVEAMTYSSNDRRFMRIRGWVRQIQQIYK